MSTEWLTTAPNPRSSAIGVDAGQRGWRCHAVELGDENVNTVGFKQIRFYRAICGLQPRHGWGMDLFIEEKCEKCLKRIDTALKLV